MMIRYSPSARGFYHAAIHGHAIPADAVPISDARHRRLLALQAAGATISARDDGYPQAHRAPRSLAERRTAAIATIKREAFSRIERVAPLWRQLNDIADVAGMSPAELAARDARHACIRAVRAASNLIEADVAERCAADLRALDVAADPRWPKES
jgi:hypothetical protein